MLIAAHFSTWLPLRCFHNLCSCSQPESSYKLQIHFVIYIPVTILIDFFNQTISDILLITYSDRQQLRHLPGVDFSYRDIPFTVDNQGW